LFNQCIDAFSRYATWQKARQLAYGALTCMGKHTITGMLTASGRQFVDWTGAYRLFSQQRIDVTGLFNVVLRNVLDELSSQPYIIAHMDDTITKKTGKHVPGTAWRRDPLGPPFHTNFIWGQRFIQTSVALCDYAQYTQSRAIPVDFHHCPTIKKPGKSADDQQREEYKEQTKKAKLSRQGSLRIKALRDKLDEQGVQEKQLLVSVDGSYTNHEVLKDLPERVTLIGRIRKDTKLYTLPDSQTPLGRKRVYGERLPTPEQIRQSDQYPWTEVKAWAAGKVHHFNVKIVKDLRWRSAGERYTLQLVIIRPLGYQLTKKSRILYRQPAYLISTDADLDIDKLLQAYLWRWEIEVNFREEKSILGCGQAQVRHPESAASVPAFIAAMYALLHLANYRSLKTSNQKTLPRPKWYQKSNEKRHTSGDLINNLRAQLWARAIGLNFSDFVNREWKTQSLRNNANPSTSAIFYMRN
jgi:hypothetical protein